MVKCHVVSGADHVMHDLCTNGIQTHQNLAFRESYVVLQATILDLTSTHKSSLGASADHLTTYASVIAKAVIAFGAIAILALLQRLRPRRANTNRGR